MMTWQQTEFLLKGVYLGLLVMIAWQQPTWEDVGLIALISLGGLALFLGVAAWRKVREGFRVRGRLLGFLLFLVLENPGNVYAGLLVGLSFGTYYAFKGRPMDYYQSLAPIAGGALLGVVFYLLRLVRDRRQRLWYGFALAVVLAGGGVALFYFRPDLFTDEQIFWIGMLLLLGMPGFYLLTFASLSEESEIEIAAICAALAVGLWILISLQEDMNPTFRALAMVIPPLLYYVYTRNVLPGLRVFKHALRGMSYRQMGETRLALISLGRALQLNPNYALAREQLWDIHRHLDVAHLQEHPDVLALINFNLCLERVAWLLLQDHPAPEQIKEAHRLLDLIVSQRPRSAPACAYWRSVALTHEKQYEQAAEQLTGVLQVPQQDSPARQAVHFRAWQLALLLHPELERRVGRPLLAQPGERMDAVAAVERQLAQVPNDPSAWDLKRVLYSDLTEVDYDAAVPAGQAAALFDHEYTKQLGLALLDDRERWQRGCAYLRIAARGLPEQAPGLYIQIAQTHDKHGDHAGLWANYQRAMQVGRAVGVQNLSPEERQNLFAVVKKIGEQAQAEERLDAALEAYKFYTMHESAGLETYRTLATLFEKKQDYWMALHCTEHGLTYNAQDKDLQDRKDRYYYNLMPADLQARLDSVRGWFDTQYCLDKARFLLERYNGDLDLLDWAAHLVELACVAEPDRLAAQFLRARVRRARGEMPETVAILEEMRQHRPSRFASRDEEHAWYFAHRMLGDLYLDEKPEQAIACLQEFSKSTDLSGADTYYKLGRAYENLGDFGRAARYYEQVTGYEQHPLYWEARDALERVRARR